MFQSRNRARPLLEEFIEPPRGPTEVRVVSQVGEPPKVCDTDVQFVHAMPQRQIARVGLRQEWDHQLEQSQLVDSDATATPNDAPRQVVHSFAPCGELPSKDRARCTAVGGDQHIAVQQVGMDQLPTVHAHVHGRVHVLT